MPPRIAPLRRIDSSHLVGESPARILMSLIKSSVSWPALAIMTFLIIVSFGLTCIYLLALRLELPVGAVRLRIR